MRRARPERVASVLGAGDLELDREKKRVSRSGREVHLGPTEFRLLEFLMQSPGRVYSREQLLDGVWGRDIYIDERTVDVGHQQSDRHYCGISTWPPKPKRIADSAFSPNVCSTRLR